MCENTECGVHFRVDIDQFERETDFIAKITYIGDWAVFTADNSFMMYTMMLGKMDLNHMTLLIKVGDKPLGDFLDGGLTDRVYDGYLSESIDKASEAHDMVVFGVESGLLTENVQPIKPLDLILRYVA